VIEKENEILAELVAGNKYREIKEKFGVDSNHIFRVAEAHRDVVPKKQDKPKLRRVTFRIFPQLDSKFMDELKRRGYSANRLLNEIIEKWYR